MFMFLNGERTRTSNRIRTQRGRNATKRHQYLDHLETRALLSEVFINPISPVAPTPPASQADVSGVVQDDSTGKGLANIEVDLLPSNSNGQPIATTNTDANGNFSFTGVQPGRLRAPGEPASRKSRT